MADRITTSESIDPNPHPQTGSRPASQPATAEAQGQPNPARGSSRSHPPIDHSDEDDKDRDKDKDKDKDVGAPGDKADKSSDTPLQTSAKIDGIKKQIEDIALAARDIPSS